MINTDDDEDRKSLPPTDERTRARMSSRPPVPVPENPKPPASAKHSTVPQMPGQRFGSDDFEMYRLKFLEDFDFLKDAADAFRAYEAAHAKEIEDLKERVSLLEAIARVRT